MAWATDPLVPWSFGLVSGPLAVWSLVTWSCRPGRGPQAAPREKLGAGFADEIYDEPEAPNEGTCLRHMMRGVFKICDEPRSPHEGACLGCIMNLNRPIGEGVYVCTHKTIVERSPNIPSSIRKLGVEQARAGSTYKILRVL